MPILPASASQAIPRGDLLTMVKARPLPFVPIHEQVFGRVNVPKNRGSILVSPNSNWYEAPADRKRAPGGKYNRPTTKTDKIDYACTDEGEEEVYDDNERANYENDYKYSQALMEICRRRTMIGREVEAAALIFNETTWPASGTTGKTVSNVWNGSSGTPIDDVAVVLGFLNNAGGDPMNATAIMSWATFIGLLNNPQIVGNAKYTRLPDQLVNDANKAMIAAALGVQRVLVGGVLKNTKTEGVTPVLASAWSDTYCWVGNLAQTGSPDEFCVGNMYVNINDGGSEVAEEYRDETIRSTIYRFRGTVGMQVNFTACGTLLKSVHS